MGKRRKAGKTKNRGRKRQIGPGGKTLDAEELAKALEQHEQEERLRAEERKQREAKEDDSTD